MAKKQTKQKAKPVATKPKVQKTTTVTVAPTPAEPAKKENFLKRRYKRYLAYGHAKADAYLASRPHRSFRITPTPRYKKGKKVERVWPLVRGSFATIWREKRYILTLMVLFSVASYILVGGISQLNFLDFRQAADRLFAGDIGAVGTTLTLFTAAVTGSLNPSVSQLQQFLSGFLVFLLWLCLVWVLRRRLSDKPTTVREALYNSGSPIIPSAMVGMAIIIQLIPGAVGIVASVLTLSGGWFKGGVEAMMVCVAGLLLVLLSIYWLAGSAMALIVVTIPGIYPWRALSAAGDLVIGQRWKIAIRMLTMAVTILICWALVLVPSLLLDGWLRIAWLPLIPAIVQLLGAFTVTYAATYVYKMYRSML